MTAGVKKEQSVLGYLLLILVAAAVLAFFLRLQTGLLGARTRWFGNPSGHLLV
jgi:hypothetical protein